MCSCARQRTCGRGCNPAQQEQFSISPPRRRTREEEAALDWQNRILRGAELIGKYHHGVPGLKHAMDLNAYYGGPPRLPLVVPGAEARREIEEAFSGFKG
jgi:4-hydroxy-2-oxoglutarate aldolase